MAKDKKKGFFSWLGFGRKDEKETQQQEAEQQKIDAAKANELQQQDNEAAIKAAEDEAERQYQEKQAQEQAAIKAAEEEAERLHQAQQAELKAAQEEAERQRQAELAAEKAAQEQAERDRQAAEAARVAEEAERQRQAELAAAKAAAEQAERDRQAAEAARVAEEEAERQRQAAEQAELEAQEIVALRDEVLSEQTEEEEPKQVEQEKPKKEGFFSRLKKGLLKTRQNLGSGFLGLFTGKKIDDDLFDELEEQLLIADVGVETTRKIIDNLTAHASRKDLKNAEALYGRLREEMSDILAGADKPLVIEDKKPYVILMVGVNGVGKTTTIGKLARQYQSEGKSVMLAAGDTFRAAAVEQLQVWGERNQIPVVAQHTGADPASVIFDAIQSAQAKGVDVLIADTAGRLQNKAHLMEELKKIVRVMKKLDEEAPHEIMLTLDASTGQNAVSQAKLFNDAVGLTGITLTKLDGTAKGGVIFSIADQFGIPIRYIGIGEGIEDLRPFKADDFIEALFAREE
ncbi:signal recognition particle-docking protein FtsY [Providencia stuartii]|uniref:Signal recognition particle receptor FtsY n=1 Tax=Providencia stuartii TaxID=588 RepID=A0A1S1HMJ2_PROST|nr:signal recognition particle-docking protein FtsY [Providencia stuartii]